MRQPWSVWKVVSLASLFSFLAYAVVYQEQHLLVNVDALLRQGLLVALDGGLIAGLVAGIRNRFVLRDRPFAK